MKYLAIPIGLLIFTTRLLLPLPSDMAWPLCAARQLGDPYGAACLSLRPDGQPWVVNPFTTVLAVWPVSWLSTSVATAAILGPSSALMAWGLIQKSPAHLLLFLSVPYLHSWYYGQWSPMMLGVALTPAWLFLTAIKPQIGLPIVLCNLTRRRALGCAVFVLVSLLISPDWPWRWIALLGTYDGYVPVLLFPPLLFLIFVPRARYLLLCACVPQRGAYDPLIVGAVLKTRRDVLLWVVAGWAITYIGWRYTALNPNLVVVLATYVPTLYPVLRLQRCHDR